MRYFDYLKKSFPFYVISGIMLSIAVFALISLHRHNGRLYMVLEDMNNISINQFRVKKEIKAIDTLLAQLRDKYHVDIDNINTDTIIMNTLDNFKNELGSASIQVSEFVRNGGRTELPVTIEAPVADYTAIIDYMKHIESFRMPDYKIDYLFISKGRSGQMMLRIRGALIMPLLEAHAGRENAAYG